MTRPLLKDLNIFPRMFTYADEAYKSGSWMCDDWVRVYVGEKGHYIMVISDDEKVIVPGLVDEALYIFRCEFWSMVDRGGR